MIESEQEDEIIAALVQSGQSVLFSTLVKRYEEKMKRYARKFLSDDDEDAL